MTRAEIRTLLRVLIDEPEEFPNGTFLDTTLDSLINVSKDRVALVLSAFLPAEFRETGLVDVTAGKSSYSIATDWSIDDCLAPCDFYRNKVNEKRFPIQYTPNIQDLAAMSNVSNLDTVLWGQEKKGYIEFSPPCLETVSDRYKFVYVKKWPDLNHDTSDTAPAVATPGYLSHAHVLIAYDAAEVALAANERAVADIQRRKEAILQEIAWNLSGIQSAKYEIPLPALKIFQEAISL